MTKATKKLRTVNIRKTKYNRHSRDEILKKTNYGFKDEYKIKTEGIGRSLQDWKDSNRRFGKNYMNAKGLCRFCPYFVKDKKNTVTGEHCSLAANVSCCQDERALAKKVNE